MPTPSSSPSLGLSGILTATLIVAAVILTLAVSALAQTETTIYNFSTSPSSGPIRDSAGNLYGVSAYGGDGNGLVYKLSKASGSWQEIILYTFSADNNNGQYPVGPLVLDSAGDLYGTTSWGGPFNAGVVFKLSPTSQGPWHESVLYAFTGSKDGGSPSSGNLVFDKAGNLYGSNVSGANVVTQNCQNTSGCGVIFKLSPTTQGRWKFSLVHTFTGGFDGVGPAQLIFDDKGTLYGSAAGAWQGFELPSSPGLVFKLTPTTNGPWTDTAIYSFTGGADGGLPSALIFDRAGNIYGTGADGGILNNCWSGYGPMGCGVVFQLSPQSNGTWKETALYAFTDGSDGGQPGGGLVTDKGNLFGTTWGGGVSSSNGGDGGVVFQFSRNSDGSWTETVTHAFVGTDGAGPRSTMIVDNIGNLYGTTVSGGTIGYGVVFEVTP